jgi:hypothetical protein
MANQKSHFARGRDVNGVLANLVVSRSTFESTIASSTRPRLPSSTRTALTPGYRRRRCAGVGMKNDAISETIENPVEVANTGTSP